MAIQFFYIREYIYCQPFSNKLYHNETAPFTIIHWYKEKTRVSLAKLTFFIGICFTKILIDRLKMDPTNLIVDILIAMSFSLILPYTVYTHQYVGKFLHVLQMINLSTRQYY
ncbi:hypothetical protein HZS_735 [Henneguya salminicola]|nr:hypothetical protein HZS_735 [Henneguya salminicola]